MDTVLIVLGVIGFGAIVISAYVFTVAARHYVSDDDPELDPAPSPPSGKVLATRRPDDRRQGKPVTFPLVVNGTLIPRDRRRLPERRLDMA